MNHHTILVRENSSKDGAERLAQRIRDFWQAQGFPILTWIELCGRHNNKNGEPVWGVRSTLCDGWPSEKSQQARAA